MFWILFFILFGLLFLEWFLNGRKRGRMFMKIPGPPGTLIFGNGLEVATTPVKSFRQMRKWANQYNNLFRIWAYPFGVINIYNPEDTEIIVSNSKYNEKSIIYDFIKPWLNDGLLLSKGNKWLQRRKILTPAFHFNILQEFSKILDETSNQLVQDLDKKDDGVILDVVTLMSDVTLNAICETSMGTKLTEDKTGAGKTYKSAIHEIGKLIIYRMSRVWLVKDAVFDMTKQGRRQKEVLKIIKDFPKSVINERRKYIQEHGFKVPTSNISEEYGFGRAKRRMAMLDLLLSAEQDGTINQEGIQEEVDTFMFEGHDTTAMGLTYALLELANNESIQKRVVEELNEIFGDSDRSVNMQDMTQMKYLDCCIKETLRLYPPVPLISRFIPDDMKLGGHDVPAGENLCHIDIFDLHRREDLFEDPLVFNPERFLTGVGISKHPYAYIPFSAGPRNCIGQKFAILEMKSVLSWILRKFELKPVTNPSELEFTTDLVLRTTHPVYVKFVKRKN